MNLARRPGVRVKDVAGETLVLDDENGHIHQLNSTASFIWHRCDGETTLAQIASLFAREYGVDDAVAEKDVADVIEKLRELKLLS
jgi:hypothetical protein